ncbi:MAG: hypothetical protein SOX46_12365 [Clostridiaceae bacterium]|uniref:DUF6903 family protein n=1 Tax=Clostridium TaxID=1485 RepID=UPI0015B71293|nr:MULTISPECIES: hypothetical protein [Clostridium]MCI6138347.1 hypothetical protein [Clostridium sp.]MDU3396417.1 hypothetical protein [Clostridiales bacterium]MDY3232343.1 hypothetical protein [Clostridiaceae bacterium]
MMRVFILKGLLFVFFVGLIIWGQRAVGYLHLGAQLAGLAGLLGLLYSYNKTYQ